MLFIGDETVECVKEFKYLGCTVNESHNYRLTRLACAPLAIAASCTMQRGLVQLVAHPPVGLGVELFGTFVKSVASTGHVIHSQWLSSGNGLLKSDEINRIFTRCVKSLLGVRRTTSDNGIYFLTGLVPLSFQIAQLSIEFYIKLASKTDTELEFRALKQLLSNRKIQGTIYTRFLQPVFDLKNSDPVDVALAKIAKFNSSDFLLAEKNKFFLFLQSRVVISPKLDILCRIPSRCTLPRWLADQQNFPVRLAHTLCRVLLSSHNLLVETGRWLTSAGRIPREERRCRLCSSNVENIQHFLKDCPEFDGPRMLLANELYEHGLSNNSELLEFFIASISGASIKALLFFSKFFHKVFCHSVLCKAWSGSTTQSLIAALNDA